MTLRFKYDNGGRDRSEERDCCVRAIAIAANIPYAEAHSMLAAHGRIDNHRTQRFVFLMDVWKKIGQYKIFRVQGGGTLNQFMNEDAPGRFIVRIRGHAFAVVNGTIHDMLLSGGRCRIKQIWKFNEEGI